MDCEQARRQLMQCEDVTLDAAMAAVVDRHLSDCPSCAQYAIQLDSLSLALGRGPDIEVPPTLAAAVMARLPIPSNRAEPRFKPSPFSLLAGSALLVLSAITVLQVLPSGSALETFVSAPAHAADLIVLTSDMATTAIGFVALAADIVPVVARALPLGSIAGAALAAAAAIAALLYAESPRATV